MPGLRIGVGMNGSAGRRARLIVPPADWRMPAAVATSAALSGAQAALAAAQAAASAKGRPFFEIAAGATEHVEWTVAETGEVILSWLGQSAGAATVTRNGADQEFAPLYPAGSSIDGNGGTGGRRQFRKIVATAGDVIRLTIVAGTAARTVYPLLHKRPPWGPWDAHVVFGASREDQGLGSKALEDTVMAAHPARDPIIFNYAKSGDLLSAIQAHVATAAPALDGTACYALLGSIIGNDVNGNRPYAPAQKAALDSGIDSIVAALAGFTIGFGNTSFRNYSGIELETQVGGSLEYNDAVIHPKILEHAPDCYDGTLGRARIDEYLAILHGRASLAEEVHGAPSAQRALWVNTWFARVYAGSWAGIADQVEPRVAAAEDNATVNSAALAHYREATYAVAALAGSPAKAAHQARIAAIRPTVLFHEAVRRIDLAVAGGAQAHKDAAQAALDAAAAAGYVGGTAPNTLAYQQERIDGIAIVSFNQVVKVGFGAATAVAGWNRTASIATGILDASLNDEAGTDTGIGITVTNAPSGVSTQNGLVSQVPDVPDAILQATWNDTANSIAFTLTGLDPSKRYDLLLMPSRATGTVSSTRFSVNGAVQSPDVSNANNVSQYCLANMVAPSASGEITVVAGRGANSSFCYLTAMLLKRHG